VYYVGDLQTITETPCELRGGKVNVIACSADVVKLVSQWGKRVAISVSEIIGVGLVAYNLFFISMSSAYILLVTCFVVGVFSDEHNHIVSFFSFLY
jgi:hypothetical protein